MGWVRPSGSGHRLELPGAGIGKFAPRDGVLGEADYFAIELVQHFVHAFAEEPAADGVVFGDEGEVSAAFGE